MKKIFSSALVSLLVSVSTLAVYHFSFNPASETGIFSSTSNELPPEAEEASPIFTNNSRNVDEESTTPSSVTTELPDKDFRFAANKTMPAVVHISSKSTYNGRTRNSYWDRLFGYGESGGSRTVSTGSGVIISSDGYIVTNNHVIESADELEVTLFDNRSYKAKVIGTYPTADLGLIKIDGEELPMVELADSDQAIVGEWVLAVGNPFNLSSTATAGIVSAIGRDLNIIKDDRQSQEAAIESFIQTDAAVNPGNSGGALVNLEGKLIGINTAIASPTGAYAGYAFAVPANIVRKVVEDLVEFGKVQRAFIGILDMTSMNSFLADEYDLNVTEGVLIKGMEKDKGAAKAGIRPGDVIVSVDGVKVKNEAKLMELIARNRPGDMISVTVYRKGELETYDVTLTDINGNTQFETTGRSEILTELGVEFREANPQILQRYGFEHGVSISKLVAGQLRRQTDIKEGFIITKVNGDDVGTVESLVRRLERSRENIRFQGFYPGGRYLLDYVVEL